MSPPLLLAMQGALWLRMLSIRPELTLVLCLLCLPGTACMLWHLHAVEVDGPGMHRSI